jgi:hypothetical protein
VILSDASLDNMYHNTCIMGIPINYIFRLIIGLFLGFWVRSYVDNNFKCFNNWKRLILKSSFSWFHILSILSGCTLLASGADTSYSDPPTLSYLITAASLPALPTSSLGTISCLPYNSILLILNLRMLT